MNILRQIQQLFSPKPAQLSDFQKRKLLHEFHTFYDINKDGKLQGHDFELARDHICKKSGWKENSKQWTHCRELFVELWRNLQHTADNDDDGQITVDEWFQMWTQVLRSKHEYDKSGGTKGNKPPKRNVKKSEDSSDDESEATSSTESYIPPWFDRYVEYKFNLLDRAGDGVIDEEEFEFTLHDGFDVSPKDCQVAYRMMTKDGEKELDLAYFRELALEFYLSDKASDLGNFINGKLSYD